MMMYDVMGFVGSKYIGSFFRIYLNSGWNNSFLSNFVIFFSFVFVMGIFDVLFYSWFNWVI